MFFLQVIDEMGTSKKTHRQFSQELELYTGSLECSSRLVSNPSDFKLLKGYLYFTGSAFDRNVEHMFRLLHEMMTDTNFLQNQLLKTFISEVSQGRKNKKQLNFIGSTENC